MASRIEDYALIGDCETAALVGRDGSIDWLCWPRFDSGACFAALLGTPANGRWIIAPRDSNVRVTRRYQDNTLILETEFQNEEGAATIIDFMPPRGKSSDVIRLVVGQRGRMTMWTEFIVRFDYGSIVPWLTRQEDGALRLIAGPDMVVLRTPISLKNHDLKTAGEFTVFAGQTIPFVLTYGLSYRAFPAPVDPKKALSVTTNYWRKWCGHFEGTGEWSDAVIRSLITLKALTYHPSGGIVAAATTSLPEQLGGERNWDYRFCWLRDATFTLLSFMAAGYYEEAGAWRAWLLRAVAGTPSQVQIMYGLTGERRLTEWAAGWLPGYENSKPVRIGNAAEAQVQLDIFGEVMDALYQAQKGKLPANPADWKLQIELMKHVEKIWNGKDDGIWEVRGGPRHFVYSKVMAWLAFDRAVKSAEEFGLDGPVDRWRDIRQQIHDEVCRKGFNSTVGAFVQCYDSTNLDASILLMPLVGFLPPNDPRVISTVEAIERQLVRDDLVLRYDPAACADGLTGNEGAFLACSFWLADNLILMGRREDARRLFEKLLSVRNDVGLLSEEYDLQNKRLVGNFPQAFSHIALINTAINLSKPEKSVEHRSGRLTP